jgi:DNA-binding transcriptional ArsR family regulator
MSLRDAIRAERDQRELAKTRADHDLELLDQIDELASHLHGEAPPVAPEPEPAVAEGATVEAPAPTPARGRPATTAAPIPPARRSAGAAGEESRRKVVSALLHLNRAASLDELVETTGLSKNTVQRHLTALITDETCEATGATKSRRFRARRRDRTDSDNPVTAKRAQTLIDNERNALDAVQRVGLRDRIVKAILADRGKLGLGEIHQRFLEAPGEVQSALDYLVSKQRIVANADGTFSRGPKA